MHYTIYNNIINCVVIFKEIHFIHEMKLCVHTCNTPQDPQLVKDLLQVHDQYMEMVNTQFAGSALFQKALKVCRVHEMSYYLIYLQSIQ